MKNHKHLISSSIIVFAAVTFIGSSTQKQAAFQTAQYSWSPKQTATKQNKITIALLYPQYESDHNRNDEYAQFSLSLYEPFKTFSKSLGGDIEELITSRGYTVRGPFKTRDEMVYSDKEASHLALMISIQPEFRAQAGFTVSGRCQDGATAYRLRNTVISLGGRIELKAIEPISGEKVWVKAIEIPAGLSPKINSYGAYCSQNVLLFIREDVHVQNAVINFLQEGYGDILNKIDNHLDPSEFERLLPTIKELKERK